MIHPLKIDLPSLDATRRFAELSANAVISTKSNEAITIALNGSLGTGKTQWVRYFCEVLGVPSDQVTSPTYVLLQRYTGQRTIYHFDFYRLESERQVWDLGIDELYEQPGIVLIEWAEKFAACLPDDCLTLTFAQTESETARTATVAASGTAATAIYQAIKSSAHDSGEV